MPSVEIDTELRRLAGEVEALFGAEACCAANSGGGETDDRVRFSRRQRFYC
jgi:hypothetical protein